MQLVAFSAEGEAILLIPGYKLDGIPERLLGCDATAFAKFGDSSNRHKSRLSPLSFFKIVPVGMYDGMALCSQCSNPGCDQDTETTELFEQELAYPSQEHKSYKEGFRESEPLCRCALPIVSRCDVFPPRVVPRDNVLDCELWQWYLDQPSFSCAL